jgi:hypothetical protein
VNTLIFSHARRLGGETFSADEVWLFWVARRGKIVRSKHD